MAMSLSAAAAQEEAREYQQALLEIAKTENIIVCLPTGSGKTYIAVQLTKYYLPTTIKEKKLIVFIANTVPLVHQQAEYFRQQLSLTFGSSHEYQVREITGDTSANVWDKHTWDREMKKGQIFVMTSEILRMALDHAYILFSKLSLIILDECHHAGKDHPMAKIMEKYEGLLKEKPEYELPRVLGLTATIIRGNSNIGDIQLEVKDMEKRLCCRAVTYHDYEEVLRHSTKAFIKLKIYSSDKLNETYEIVDYLNKQVAYLNTFKGILPDSRKESLSKVHHPTLKHSDQVFNKKTKSLDEFTNALTAVKKACEELGPYAARLTAGLKKGYLKSMPTEDQLRDLLKIGADTALSKVITQIDHLMSSQPDKSQQIFSFVSNKVVKLFEIFSEWKKDEKEDKLCAIVFCKERLTAQILTLIFEAAIEFCGDMFGFIRPAYVVGNNRTQYDIKEQRTTTRKQEDVIQRFHRQEVNLLFATNVLEEGLNVPSCNVIVRFDPFHVYPSFVQSMGRARKRGALFYVLSSIEDAGKTQVKIDGYKNFNASLATHLKDETRHLYNEEDDENEVDDPNEPEPLAIDPDNPESPKISLTDAVSLVHRYCQTLAFEVDINEVMPVSWWIRVNAGENAGQFKAYITLPAHAIVQGITEGVARDSKNNAKRAAYLELCKKLYAKGAFDEKLFPRRRGTFPESPIQK